VTIHTVFQTPYWAHLLADLSGGCGVRVVNLALGEQSVVPWYLVGRRWKGAFHSLDAMPFCLYGPPLTNVDIVLDLPPELLAGRTVSLTYVGHPLLPKVSFRPPPGTLCSSRTVSAEILKLPSSEDDMWRSLSHDHRNMIRRASKEGVTTRSGSGADDTDIFCHLYEETTQNWGYSKPPYSRSFFKKLLGQSADLGIRLVLAERQDCAIAAAVIVDDVPSPLYWFGAMKKRSSKYYPTYLLLWNEIRRAISNGHMWFNFGSSGHLQGVRQFKLSWGAKTADYQILTIRKEPLCSVFEAIVDPFAKVRRSVNRLAH
jgi:hypothetical protein